MATLLWPEGEKHKTPWLNMLVPLLWLHAQRLVHKGLNICHCGYISVHVDNLHFHISAIMVKEGEKELKVNSRR